MGQLIIQREKVRSLFADLVICYINDHQVCELKNGEETTCEVDNNVIEFKCFLSGGSLSEAYKLDMSNRDSLKITLKKISQSIEISILDQNAIIDITKSRHLSAESIGADLQTICSATNVSLKEAQSSLIRCGFNINIAIKELGGPENFIQESQNNPTSTLFTPTQTVGGYFGINEKTRQWAVGKGFIPSLKNAPLYSYDDIIDFELLEDETSVTKGGLGRAAVGGLLFGGVGAVVGGVTGGKKAHQKCTSLTVKITVNNMNAPTEYIKLITSPVDKNTLTYKAAFQNAQSIISMLQLICSQRETKTITQPTVAVKEISSADEIRKFKNLMDEGIITEEEFNAKKKQLLGL